MIDDDINNIRSSNLSRKKVTDIEALESIGIYISNQVGFTPPQVATAYNIPANDGAGVKIGIISFGGGFLQSDLNKTFADLIDAGLISVGTTTPVINQVLLNGETGEFGIEGDFDFENTIDIYAIATMVPAADINIYIGNNFLSTINQAIADGCHILSISYTYANGEPSSGTMSAFEYFLLPF